MVEFDVVVVGSINTDMSVFTSAFPDPGETVIGSEFVTGFGGKGANQSVAAKLLGCKVALVAKVGNDGFGRSYIAHLKKTGVNCKGVKETSDASTGVAFITVVRKSGENRIIVVPGANMQLSLSDINSANRQGLLNSRVVVCQFEVNAAATLHALRLAQSNGALTILNPAPPPVPSTERGYFELLPEFLAASDYCCPNETEALQMIHRCPSSVTTVEGGGDGVSPLPDEFLTCLDWLAEHGVKQPMITLGAKGVAILLDSSEVPAGLPVDVTIVQSRKSRKDSMKGVVLLLSAPHVHNVIDTTGAGDSFVGALAYFVSSHPHLGTLEHVRRALWVASQSVRKVGTQSSYPNRDELHPTLFEASVFQWPSADK